MSDDIMICENISSIRKKIEETALRAGRNPSEVKLLGATKNVPVSKIKEAVSCGLDLFGENYVQEAKTKISDLGPGITLHFIGRLQVNKAKYAVRLFDLIHSLDSEELALELNRRARSVPRRLPVLIEINLGEEKSKGGIIPAELQDFISKILPLENLVVRGLMTIPPFFENPEEARPFFRRLRELKENLEFPGLILDELSMGMSGDFEVAIEEGATIVRIGTALFGPRSTV